MHSPMVFQMLVELSFTESQSVVKYFAPHKLLITKAHVIIPKKIKTKCIFCLVIQKMVVLLSR